MSADYVHTVDPGPIVTVSGHPPLLDQLLELGVTHIEVGIAEAGGRWQIAGQWVAYDPGKPRTLATERSGHFERLGSIESVVSVIIDDLGEE